MDSDLRSGNRFEKVQSGFVFDGITELHLDQTLMPWDEVCLCLLKVLRGIDLYLE